MSLPPIEEAKRLLGEGRRTEAVLCLQSALEEDSASEEARIYLAATWFDLGELDRSGEECRILLKQIPHHYLSHFFLGQIAERRGNLDEAIESLMLALAIRPGEEKAFRILHALLERTGRLADYRTDAEIVFVTGGLFLTMGFHAHTPSERAIGGSELALISVARELSRLGARVAVYCNCDLPGIHDGVRYRSNREFALGNRLAAPKILIASRFSDFLNPPTQAGKKILWVQDIATSALYEDLTPDRCPFDTLFCLGRYQAEGWKRQFGLADERIYMTLNGYDPSLYAQEEIPRRNQLIYLSRPSRGLDVCLKVFRRLREKFPDLELAVCTYTQYASLAEDPEFAPFQAALRQPGIRFLEGLCQEDLVRELKQSRLMLYPNTTEAECACVAAIQALAAGCPVVTSSRGAMPETVVNGKTGLVVPFSPDEQGLSSSLFEAATSLLTDLTRWQTLSRQSALYAREKYTWGRIAREWIEFLHRP